jgi:hypothetical protein
MKGNTVQCLLISVSKLTHVPTADIIEYLGHNGDGRGYNIFEMIEFLLRKTQFKPVYLERQVWSSNGQLLSTDLTEDYYDLPIPKIVTSIDGVPHAVSMCRDGSVYDSALRRGLNDRELEELRCRHHSLMLLY